MTAVFDKTAYDAILDDVETYLGYLKGNELVYEYLKAVEQRVYDSGRQYSNLKNYTTPCPDPAFTYRPLYFLPVLETGAHPEGFEAKIFTGADECWHKGKDWAAGIAGQARAITEQITSPDAAELETALKTMTEDVLLPLELLIDSNADLPEPYRIPLPDGENSIDGDWAKLDGVLNSWHGIAADEFRTLYRNLNTCVGVYAYFAGAAALELATATAVIAAAQSGLSRSVKDVRETLIAQLTEWNETDKPPVDEEVTWFDVAVELLPITRIYKAARLITSGLLSRKDPESIKTIIAELAGIKGTIHKLFGKQVVQDNEQPFEAVNSDEVLSSLTKLLRDSYLHHFMEALSDLSASSSGSLDFLNTLQDQGMWAPPKVPEGSVRGNGDSYPA